VSNQRLNSLQIAEFLAVAGSRRDATESERIEAVKNLLFEYRLQITEYKSGQRSGIDPILEQGITEWGRRIFADPNPTLALARFLGQSQERGKRAKHSDRDLSIALAVTIRGRGSNIAKAVETVASLCGLKRNTVMKIYSRRKTEAKAYLAMAMLEEQLSSIKKTHPEPL
jgi:hypothetical protein